MKKRLLLIGILIIRFSLVFSYDIGSIKGRVIDAGNGESIPGVNVIIENTMLGTATDIKGKFEFRSIHPGNYTLIMSYIGYETQQAFLKVKTNGVTEVLIKLKPSSFAIEGYSIFAERPLSAATSNDIQRIDLMVRPVTSSQDLLKLVPGLITAQHAGGGKAEQIFLRGFDADHGTDINISVDGIPVNMVSHGHGQGYADLHFLIPELVNDIAVFKGPYFTQFGNFATASSVGFKTKDILESNLVKLELGQFHTGKFTMLYQLGKGSAEQNGYVATQYYSTDGPFESPQGLQRFNVYGKYFVNLSHTSRLTVSFSSYGSAWDASGQIPERVVKESIISRFGAIDNMEGGTTGRQDFSLGYDQKSENNSSLSIQAYMSKYDFKLFSNFTYFLYDTVNGDMIEQNDNRIMYGLNTCYKTYKQIGNKIFKTTLGAGFRADDIQVSLWHSPNRNRLQDLSDAMVFEKNLFIWAQKELVLNNSLRFMLGLRGDYFTFNVNDLLASAIDTITNLPHASGYKQQSMLNPKFGMVYSPIEKLEIYLNGGSGFHSNDARNVIIREKVRELEKIWKGEGLSDQEIDEKLDSCNFDHASKKTTTLPRALGGEIGLRSKLANNLELGLAGWYVYLEKEFVYVGDGGYTELSNPTRRLGIDVEARQRVFQWLWADLDMTFSKGKLIDAPSNKNHIPLAPEFTLSGGLSMLDYYGFDGTLRFIHIGDRPANEDNSMVAKGHSLVNIGLAYHWGGVTFSINVENLLNVDWKEAQFDTESRMDWETTPVSEIHFTPGNPINFQFGLGYKFD